MNEEFNTNNGYPIVTFLVKHGKSLAYLLSALVLAGVIGLGVAAGTFSLIPVAVIGSLVLLGLLLSYVEVLRIIADTLIPKY